MYPDDNEEHPFAQQQRAAEQQASMARHALRMRHDGFMDELNEEQLATFNEMMNVVSGNEAYAHFLLGASTTILRVKFGSCPCGEDHSSPAHPLIEQTRAEMGVQVPVQVPVKVEHAVAPVLSVDEDLMKEYTLAPNNHGTLSCTGCGMDYQSLDDRMLRNPGPDGCSGCQYKSGHG